MPMVDGGSDRGRRLDCLSDAWADGRMVCERLSFCMFVSDLPASTVACVCVSICVCVYIFSVCCVSVCECMLLPACLRVPVPSFVPGLN